jgi:hypothetical protein
MAYFLKQVLKPFSLIPVIAIISFSCRCFFPMFRFGALGGRKRAAMLRMNG